MAKAKSKRGKRRKSIPFPMEQFKNLLRRYCRENYSAKDFEDHASYTGAYIGVCIGDDCGSYNKVIIGAPTIEEILAADHEGVTHA